MSPFRTLAPLLALFPAVSVARADALDDALRLLRAAPAAERGAAVAAVLALEPTLDDVLARLRKPPLPAPLEAGWHVRSATDEHGVARPFQLYVPASLATRETPPPLLVYLHGGVSRPDFTVEEGEVGYGRLWLESARRGAFPVAFPMGRQDCVWWRPEGASHIRAVVRESKRLVPVDDDAVLASGFSDGGSGCFYLAMAEPEPFAAFLPMNGHPAVAASASGAQLYLRNLALRPLYATMTRDDALYPAATILEHLVPALHAGAPIRVASWEEGNHRPVYFEELRASFEAYVNGAARRAVPDAVQWRCASPSTGAAAWVEVLEIGPAAGDAPDEPDLNVMSAPGRVRLGVNVDRAFGGPGVRVSGVADGSPAAAMGVKEGDVITGIDGAPVAGMEDLVKALGGKTHGDEVHVRVRREEETTLRGGFPEFRHEPYYRRASPTARVSVRVEDGALFLVTRNVRRLRLSLPPDLLPPGPLSIERNGKRLDAEAIDLSLEEILRSYGRDADSGRVFTRRLILDLPPG